eukprot:c873_g2_i1 orf=120-278(+)
MGLRERFHLSSGMIRIHYDQNIQNRNTKSLKKCMAYPNGPEEPYTEKTLAYD